MNFEIIMQIISAIMEAIGDCDAEEVSVEHVYEVAQNPTGYHRWKVASIAKRECIHCEEFKTRREGRKYWKLHRDELLAETWEKIQDATPGEVAYEVGLARGGS